MDIDPQRALPHPRLGAGAENPGVIDQIGDMEAVGRLRVPVTGDKRMACLKQAADHGRSQAADRAGDEHLAVYRVCHGFLLGGDV